MYQILHILHAFDEGWIHQCESLRSVLHDVTAEESRWQHPAYAAEVLVGGLPQPGTICWHVAHLEHCARHYTDILRRRPVIEEPLTPPPGVADLNELIRNVEAARKIMREEIQRLTEVDLEAPCARGMDRCGVSANGNWSRDVARRADCSHSTAISEPCSVVAHAALPRSGSKVYRADNRNAKFRANGFISLRLLRRVPY